MKLDYTKIWRENFELFFKEDDLNRNFSYISSLPSDLVNCKIHIKDDMILAGLPFFFETFNYLKDGIINYESLLEYEGRSFQKSENKIIEFALPFNIALSGERIALNLLQRSSSIATFTSKFTQKAGEIKILDTRKTTPGLRFIEKYGVRLGGGYNHRFGQTDAWMVKDNHKNFFGGVKGAIEFFKNQRTMYQPIIVEIHDLAELKEVAGLGVRHFMLDNFRPDQIKEAVRFKQADMTYEVSGGINLENLGDYLIVGVDAISSGSLTYAAPPVDISLKYHRN